jgi:hypothetical protein
MRLAAVPVVRLDAVPAPRAEGGVMTGETRPPAWPLRLARLLIGPSRLRRPWDRLEGLIVLLSAAFVAAVTAAPWFGEDVYRSQRAYAAELHPAVAVLTNSGPSASYTTRPGRGQRLLAGSRWPVGKGVLTVATAPGISGAPAGAHVKIWLTSTGQPRARRSAHRRLRRSCAAWRRS